MKLKSGFSLIELLVVVAIIGILAAIGTVGYNNYVASAGVAASTANAKQLADALTAEDTKFSSCQSGDTAEACLKKLASDSNIPVNGVSSNGITINCDTKGAVNISGAIVDNCKTGDDAQTFTGTTNNNFK